MVPLADGGQVLAPLPHFRLTQHPCSSFVVLSRDFLRSFIALFYRRTALFLEVFLVIQVPLS